MKSLSRFNLAEIDVNETDNFFSFQTDVSLLLQDKSKSQGNIL